MEGSPRANRSWGPQSDEMRRPASRAGRLAPAGIVPPRQGMVTGASASGVTERHHPANRRM